MTEPDLPHIHNKLYCPSASNERLDDPSKLATKSLRTVYIFKCVGICLAAQNSLPQSLTKNI